MTTPSPSGRPTSQRRYMLRRIIALALAAVAIGLAAGAGVWLQKNTGWSVDYLTRKSRHSLVSERTEHESAVAIPERSSRATGTSNDRTPGASNTKESQPGAGEPSARDHRGGEASQGAATDPATSTSPAPVLRNTQHSAPLRGAPRPGHNGQVQLTSGGLNRQAVLHVPADALPRQSQTTRPKPLILAFHGYGQSGAAMARFGDLARDGAIVAYPDGVDKAWAGAPYATATGKQDLALVRDLINRIAATYQVDDLRIYAAGMSNGGGFVAKLACEMPQEFAAFASVAGAYYKGTWQNCATRAQRGKEHPQFHGSRATSFLEIHGEDDSRIHYEGGSRYGTPYLGAMSFTSAYAHRASCFGAPAVRNVTPIVRRYQWRDCAADKDVMHIAVKGMGHTWPGEGEAARPGESGIAGVRNDGGQQEANPTRAVNAGAEILSFFTRHRK